MKIKKKKEFQVPEHQRSLSQKEIFHILPQCHSISIQTNVQLCSDHLQNLHFFEPRLAPKEPNKVPLLSTCLRELSKKEPIALYT